MTKRSVTGESTLTWVLEFDNDEWATEEFFASFSRSFYRIDNLRDFGEWIGENFARGTAGGFLDGAGPINQIRQELTLLDENGDPAAKVTFRDEEWRTYVEAEGVTG